ncbi:endonuclease/exonuclease/phosphatase family protein [Streptomyces sp. NPDC060194]|uniref:endonuclease/exonuclease/phosphatase family protein n=1 Tax=Streptomyces sp. NPDC060194 TaxID=3347069 RepID=UPI0036527260
MSATPATPLPEQLPASRTGSDGSVTVRVLSYNIRSMRDDEAALARVIAACAPDLVLVQEAPRFFRWRKHLARLAHASGLYVLSGGATAAGPALLCSLRAAVERTEDVLLPRTPGLHQRGFATAVVRVGGVRIGLVSCHLSLQKDERYAQSALLLDQVRRFDEAGVRHVIAGGDLNERPDGRSFRRLSGALQDAWCAGPWGGEQTSTPADPHQRIDAILTTPGIEVLGCGVPTGLPAHDLRAATDHLPVLAALRIPAPA